MKEGRIVADGNVPDIITSSLIGEVFNIPVHVMENPYGHAPVIVYAQNHHP
jgi:ABC-type cobalamin/Fe3+-siderophores transport system ATPase subunit